MIKKLIYKGANLTALDKKGRTPLKLAIENNKKNIVDMLSNKHLIDETIFTTPPFTNKLGNSYFNVIFFIALHVAAESIVFFFLLPCNYIRLLT